MSIDLLLQAFGESNFGELRDVAFQGEDLVLAIDVHSGTERLGQYDVRAHRYGDFRIRHASMEHIRFESAAPELAIESEGGAQFLVLSENPDWDRFIGALYRRFGELPGLMYLPHVKETLRFATYRLPLTVPKSREAELQELCASLGIELVASAPLDAATPRSHVLRWATDVSLFDQKGGNVETSYVMAETFDVTPHES